MSTDVATRPAMNLEPLTPEQLRDTTVFVVDDDEAVRDSLLWLLEANGFRVQCFDNAETFLADYDADRIGCLILDVRMPGMSGLELQDRLLARGHKLPIVFVTGHGDVPMAVSTMKKGAIDFIEKPFSENALRETVERMLSMALAARKEVDLQRQTDALMAKLTAREQQVLDRIVAGRLNKQIADDLNISIKTVEAHRANIMDKLGARTLADLMKVALRST